MNVAITLVLICVFAVLGFCVGCFACLSKINQLEYEKKTLKEWLAASRETNTQLIKENDELRNDLEAVINGRGLI